MNVQFEREFQEYAASKGALYVENLSTFRGFSIAIDADLLLSQIQ